MVFIAAFLGVSEIATILGAGLAGLLWFGLKGKLKSKYLSLIVPLIFNPEMDVKVFSGVKLFLVFLKIGAVLFGGGYVLVAYLDGELVENLGWLTKQELMDAIAIGQFTPGPILSTATFIGYQMNGVWGALLATIGIFLFVFLCADIESICSKTEKFGSSFRIPRFSQYCCCGLNDCCLYSFGAGYSDRLEGMVYCITEHRGYIDI